MLTNTWKDQYVAQEQRADQLEKAELQRELRSIQISEGQLGWSASLMLSFAKTVQVWGCRLQSRYERLQRQQKASAMGANVHLLGGSSIQRNC